MKIHEKSMKNSERRKAGEIVSQLAAGSLDDFNPTCGHEGRSYCSTAPIRVYGLDECSCSSNMRARHRSSRVNVILHNPVIFGKHCGRGCFTPCSQDIQSGCSDVRLPREKKESVILVSEITNQQNRGTEHSVYATRSNSQDPRCHISHS